MCIRDSPNTIQYKYAYTGEYHRLNISARRLGQHDKSHYYSTVELPNLYNSPLPISKEKKSDLLTMCKKGVIPEVFHPCYESIATSDASR